MQFSAHYKTQQSMWDVQVGKALTNRRITALQKLGYYGSGIVRAQFKEEHETKRKRSIQELFAKF